MYLIQFGTKLPPIKVTFGDYLQGICKTCEAELAVPEEEMLFSSTDDYYGTPEWCCTKPEHKCPACNGVDIEISKCPYNGYDYVRGCIVNEPNKLPKFYLNEDFKELCEKKNWEKGLDYIII